MSVLIIADQPEKNLFERSRVLMWAMVALIVAVGLAIRLYDLTDLPLDFHSTRQMHSALIARGMYYQFKPDAQEWQRQLTYQQWQLEGLIEPQIMERLAAFTYGLVGAEHLWIPRLYAIFFWMVAALFLFLLARSIIGTNGAVAALAFFLILPYAAIASRAFQPEPLLLAMLSASFWAMARWYRAPSWKRAVLAGVLAGLAIYVKSTAVFFIGGAWIGLVLGGLGLRRALRSKQVWAMAALTVIPYLCYHIYAVYIIKLLEGQFSLRFFPQLWLDPVWYLRWNGMISQVTGFEFFLIGVLGLFLVRDRAARGLLLGALGGYFIYSFVFSYYIETHNYYHEPLIPLVALGVGAAFNLLVAHLRGPRWTIYPLVLGVMLFAITIKAWDVRNTLKRDDYRPEVAYWQKMGDLIGRDHTVVGLTQDYGYRLEYWGWLTPSNWMSSGDFNLRALAGQQLDPKKIFEEQTAGKDYFLVTLMDEFDHQPALKSVLTKGYAVYKQGGDFIIFDLHKPLK